MGFILRTEAPLLWLEARLRGIGRDAGCRNDVGVLEFLPAAAGLDGQPAIAKLTLHLDTVDIGIAAIDRRRTGLECVATRELRAAQQNDLNILVLAVETGHVEPQTVIEPVALGADLVVGQRFRANGTICVATNGRGFVPPPLKPVDTLT